MKRGKGFVFLGLFVIALLIFGCGQTREAVTGGEHNPTVSAQDLFNVSGAKAIATATAATVSTSSIRAAQSSIATELLKLSASGSIESVFSSLLESQWHPPISVIETGPDGSLYVGFRWPLWVRPGTAEGEEELDAALFRIKPDGTVEIVDQDIYGVGNWYGYAENGELPKKQIQFDNAGSVYYLGESSAGTTVLKKKTTSGTISQIGTNRMAVRDFLVADNGFVFFHGSNSDSWSVEWLRVVYNNAVNNIFYNDGNGWLRAYYNHVVGSNNYVFLVGENLMLLDANEVPKSYSGIIRVSLDTTGAPVSVEALYDDKNMYSETYDTIGGQLTWGYWDPVEMEDKRFFAKDNYNETILPLTLESGVTEEDIRNFIRRQYQSKTLDNLDQLTFAGITTDESWQIRNYLDDLISAHISGKTWAKWRQENGLQGVRFGNAKQLVFADSGELYAVISLDNWGSGSSKGDKLFRIVNASGEADIAAYLQDTAHYYKSMSKVRAYGNYAIYLSSKVGQYKILRLDLTDPARNPVDMIPDKTNVEIFSFNYNADTGMLLYDVYDLDNNTSYLAQQEITSTTVDSEISAEGYTITDIVPFTATN